MREIAKENGVSSTIYHQRVRKGWPKEKAATEPVRKKYTGEYAVYKGDEIIAMGTDKECAEELGVRSDYIRWLTTPTGKRRLANRKDPGSATTAVKLDE